MSEVPPNTAADSWIKMRTGGSATAAYLDIANSGPFIPDDAVPSLFDSAANSQPCARQCTRDERSPPG